MIGAGGTYPEQSTAPVNALVKSLAERCRQEMLRYPDHYPTSFTRKFDFPYAEALQHIPETVDERVLKFYGGMEDRIESLETSLEYEDLTEEERAVEERDLTDPHGFSPPYESYLGRECIDEYLGHIVSFLLDPNVEELPVHDDMEIIHLLRLQEMYSYAQGARADAKDWDGSSSKWKSHLHPLEATSIRAPAAMELLKPALSSLNPETRTDLAGTTVRERTGYLLEWMVPVMVVLEHYAKRNLTHGEEPPEHIKELAEQGIIFWSKLASTGAILENLSGRISDASFILLFPERYEEEMTRTIHALFGHDPTNPFEHADLLHYLPTEIQNALLDETEPDSLSSQLKSFISNIEDKLIPQHVAFDVIQDRIIPEIEDERLARRVSELALSLDQGIYTETLTLAEIRSRLEQLGVQKELVEILRPQLRLRFKSAYRVMVKRNERRQKCTAHKYLDRVDPSLHGEFFSQLDHYPKAPTRSGPEGRTLESERVLMLKRAPYLYTDVIGIRIIIPITPTLGLARQIEREISRLGDSKEPDLRRVAIPPDINWAAAHYMLLGLYKGIRVCGRVREVKGPVEIQITGQTTVQTGASKSSSAHTQVHIGEFSPDAQFEARHQVAFPGTWLDVIARAAPAYGLRADDISTYYRCTLHTATKSGNTYESLPLDGTIDRGMYFVSLDIEPRDTRTDMRTVEQVNVPRINQMIRALPRSDRETKDRVVPAIYSSIPERRRRGRTHNLFTESEILHFILRAHGSQFRVHDSPIATYALAVELQRVMVRSLGSRSTSAMNLIGNLVFRIDNVYRATNDYDIGMMLELSRTLIELYINGEIQGSDLALAANKVESQVKALIEEQEAGS